MLVNLIANNARFTDPYYQILSEYDHEIPQSHTADQPSALRGRATERLQ